MSGHGTMRRAFENGYLRGRIAGISFAEEENRSRIDSLMSGEAAALERVAELELCIACEVEIAFDIACEAESASAGESAALERVSELEHELLDARKEELLCYRHGDWASPFVDRVISDIMDGLE